MIFSSIFQFISLTTSISDMKEYLIFYKHIELGVDIIAKSKIEY